MREGRKGLEGGREGGEGGREREGGSEGGRAGGRVGGMTVIHILIGMFNSNPMTPLSVFASMHGIAPVKFVCIYCTSICDNI